MYISNIEKGKNNPPDESQLEKIADVLNLDEQMRFELIDKAAAERGTVARDLVMALAKNKKLRQHIRSMIAEIML
jgi:transcriptional regulator with XRE-family HTH domain